MRRQGEPDDEILGEEEEFEIDEDEEDLGLPDEITFTDEGDLGDFLHDHDEDPEE